MGIAKELARERAEELTAERAELAQELAAERAELDGEEDESTVAATHIAVDKRTGEIIGMREVNGSLTVIERISLNDDETLRALQKAMYDLGYTLQKAD